jgi:hypothetical protein
MAGGTIAILANICDRFANFECPTGFHPCRPLGVPPGLENVPFAPFSKNDPLGKASDWTSSNFARVQAGVCSAHIVAVARIVRSPW